MRGEIKMRKYTKIVLATALLLVITSWAVYAHSGEEVKDWWTEMKDHHTAIHGDDFDTHHQDMHGDDWQEHVASCHSSTDSEDMGAGSMMDGAMM
jgi:Spy/CpxP family protein refolding chaperone